MNETINISKSILRKNMKKQRINLSRTEWQEKSKEIFKKLIVSDLLEKSSNIFVYNSIKNEVCTDELIDFLLIQGKEVALPVCHDSQIELTFVQVSSREDLLLGKYGILEPIKLNRKVFNSLECDCIIVPGVAFDFYGNRLGYGKGYYDAFLSKLSSKAIKIGLCYDFQLLENVPTDSEDIPVDFVVTETHLLETRSRI